LGKGFMFAITVFIAVCISGAVVAGSISIAATSMTVAISDADTTITVTSTEGFPDYGIVVIEDEHIAYSDITATTFTGNIAQPLLRGVENTDAAEHSSGCVVRPKAGAMINTGMDYYVAVLVDSAGAQAFIAKPIAFFQIIGSFLTLPLGFLGTDLQMLTYIWAIIGIGLLIAFVINMAGGRRV